MNTQGIARSCFDDSLYARDHPDAVELVDQGRYRSLHEHFLVHIPAAGQGRYTRPPPAPLVSVVVPAYNAQAFLAHALESILAQTYPHWECIVVDDRSTDRSPAIARQYAANEPRFQVVVHGDNAGPSAARNTGLRLATGEYICFLDADDLLTPPSIQNRLNTLRASATSRLAGSYSASQQIDLEVQQPPAPVEAPGMRVIDFITASGRCPFNMNQPMLRTAVLRHLGGFDESLRQAEDWECWLRILRHGYFFVPTGISDVTYRRRRDSQVRSSPLGHLETSLTLHRRAHAALPVDQVHANTPFVYREPWIHYKQQLDIAHRVFEFIGMSLAAGSPPAEAARLFYRALPDFFGAIAPHRVLEAGLARGIQRYLCSDATVTDGQAYASRDLVNAFIAELSADPRPDDSKPETAESRLAQSPSAQRRVDVLFLPHKDYHVWTLSLLLEGLDRAGLHCAFIDLSQPYRDEGARGKLSEMGLPWMSYNGLVLGDFRPKLVVCMNDWEPTTKRIVEVSKLLGIPTVGLVEGVQDYLDVDTGRTRDAYRTVDYVVLPGAFDRRYFLDDETHVRVGGVPRIDELLDETPSYPDRPLVIINSNFTYNVLTDERDAWVQMAVQACRDIEVDYLISRHPADLGDFSAYAVANESLYDLLRRGSVLISRFSSAILESLALGKPVVYFNPHGERVDKFTEPEGAFLVATELGQLREQLRAALQEPAAFEPRAAAFLHNHCGVSRSGPSATARVVAELVDIAHTSTAPPDSQRALLGSVLQGSHQRRPAFVATGRPRPADPLSGAAAPTAQQTTALQAAGPRASEGQAATSPGRLDRVRRKLRKLTRDPRAFFADSRYVGPAFRLLSSAARSAEEQKS